MCKLAHFLMGASYKGQGVLLAVLPFAIVLTLTGVTALVLLVPNILVLYKIFLISNINGGNFQVDNARTFRLLRILIRLTISFQFLIIFE